MRRPRSYRRYAADGSLVLGGAAAILLQMLDPVVARGVAEHSAFRRDPVGRLRGTLGYVYAIGLGDSVESGAAASRVDRAHSGVPGADGAEHQLWVAATLAWTGLEVHRAVWGPVPPVLVREVLAESARLGTALQLPATAWPADRRSFAAYWDERIGALAVGEDARRVAQDLLHPASGPWWLRAAMPAIRVLTAELLPRRVRRGYGLQRRPVAAALLLAVARMLAHLLPRRAMEAPSRALEPPRASSRHDTPPLPAALRRVVSGRRRHAGHPKRRAS